MRTFYERQHRQHNLLLLSVFLLLVSGVVFFAYVLVFASQANGAEPGRAIDAARLATENVGTLIDALIVILQVLGVAFLPGLLSAAELIRRYRRTVVEIADVIDAHSAPNKNFKTGAQNMGKKYASKALEKFLR